MIRNDKIAGNWWNQYQKQPNIVAHTYLFLKKFKKIKKIVKIVAFWGNSGNSSGGGGGDGVLTKMYRQPFAYDLALLFITSIVNFKK